MTSDGRKHMRVALPADQVERFGAAKKKAEDGLKVQMSDSQFAVVLISWALRDD